MRKRSKYRPRPVLVNPVAYAIESVMPAAQHPEILLSLKIRNHAALANLTQGKATRADIDELVSAVNMTEALYRLGFGREYNDIVKQGLEALRCVGARGHETGRYILKYNEMQALNTIMELHDAQLDLCSVKDIERGIEVVKEEFRLHKATPIVETKK
jgi:uncharacterized membrane-anchored protein